MRSLCAVIVRLCQSEDGPTAVEYAVMLAFIITICYAAISAVGGVTNSKFADPTLQSALGGS